LIKNILSLYKYAEDKT